MNPNKDPQAGCSYKDGQLPMCAPLGMSYVPEQKNTDDSYDPNMALVRGTLFPGLDLPFMGMVNQKEKNPTPMNELQALGFAIQELALYLDTHREDKEALKVYQEYQKLYNHCRREYLKERGPLNHSQETTGDQYTWLNDPWPWEYCKNKEV